MLYTATREGDEYAFDSLREDNEYAFDSPKAKRDADTCTHNVHKGSAEPTLAKGLMMRPSSPRDGSTVTRSLLHRE